MTDAENFGKFTQKMFLISRAQWKKSRVNFFLPLFQSDGKLSFSIDIIILTFLSLSR